MRILWVEDELDDNRTYYDTLIRPDTEIRLASTVHEALTLLQSTHFDLIIVDLNIPIGNGPLMESYPDGDLNGTYVVEYVWRTVASQARIICLTNFWEKVGDQLKPWNVEIVPKVAYLKEVRRIVYGEPPPSN